MRKSDVEYAQIKADSAKFALSIDLIKQVITATAYLGAIWLIFEGLAKILSGQKADGIMAIATVIEALKIGSILGYAWGAGMTVAWKNERSGKKRAIIEKNRYQILAESSHPNRTTSGLNSDGSTPER